MGLLGALPSLSTFRDALAAASLAGIPGGQVTVFAPSNAAFTTALLSGQLWQELGSTLAAAAAADSSLGAPRSASPDPAAPANSPQLAAAIQRLLLDHIAPGRLTLADLQSLAAGAGGTAALQMVSGRNATVAAAPNGALLPAQGCRCNDLQLPLTKGT